MTPLDYILIALIAAAFIGSGVYIGRCHRRGKCAGCSGDCSRCKGCSKKQ